MELCNEPFQINTDLSAIKEISNKFGNLPYMTEPQALLLETIINKYDLVDLLELGFYHGKSSIYIGAIMKARGRGHLTTIDLKHAQTRTPNILQLIEHTGYKNLITPIFAHRSYTWELAKMIQKNKNPIFDFCYLDGGHNFDNTALGVSLLSILMKPGGILILDDLNWSIEKSPFYNNTPEKVKRYSDDEKCAMSVRMVWEEILPKFGFRQIKEITDFSWGIAQKI